MHTSSRLDKPSLKSHYLQATQFVIKGLISQQQNRMQKSQVELLLSLLHKLYRIKSSFIFRLPVDPVMFPDYRTRIAQPVDLSTMIGRLLAAEYPTPAAVRDDLLLMIRNCREYNSNAEVLKIADVVAESIDGAWLKFQTSSSQCPVAPITYCPRVLEQLRMKNAKFMEKETKSLCAREQQLDKYPSILPPLPYSLFLTQEQKLSEQFPYKPEKYAKQMENRDFSSAKFSLNVSNIAQMHSTIAERKRRKYRKLLYRTIEWLSEKVFMKFIEKQPKNSSSLQYLAGLSDGCKIADQLKLYSLTNFYRLSLLWYQHFHFHLSEPLQAKFISTCRDGVRCIKNSMKYQEEVAAMDGLSLEEHLAVFKQKLIEDERGSLKRYLKIQIRQKEDAFRLKLALDDEMTNVTKREDEQELREANQEIDIIKGEESITMHMEAQEWVNRRERTERSEKTDRDVNRGFGRSSRAVSTSTMSQQFQDREKVLERRKNELAEDEMFLHTHYSRYNPELIRLYAQMLEIDWYSIHQRKLPRHLQLDFQALSLGPNH